MRRRLAKYGLSFSVAVAAVPGEEVGTFDSTCRPTERACATSHIRLWQTMVAEGIPAALILEDDAVFRHDWQAITQAKLDALQTEDPQWDALFLNSWNASTVSEAWHVCKDQWMAGAYILRLPAATWLLHSFSKQYSRSDSMTIAMQARGHSYFYYPWLAIQEGDESFNGNRSGAVFLNVVRSLQNSWYGLENYDFLPPLSVATPELEVKSGSLPQLQLELDEGEAKAKAKAKAQAQQHTRVRRITVVTYCVGYPYEVYDRFAGTLYDTGFAGTLYFIVSSAESDISVRIANKYPKCRFWVDIGAAHAVMHINCRRFFLFQALLAEGRIEAEADMVFLCDSRDVLFQDNMEAYPLPSDVDLFVFQEGCLFRQEPRFNVPWMKQVQALMKDGDILSRVWDLPVLCCGTTLGTVAAMRQYVDVMCRLLLEHRIVTNLDQGLHNYLVYCTGGGLSGLTITCMANSDGFVNTVGFIAEQQTSSGALHLNEKQQIVTLDEKPACVVHQYDRFPARMLKAMTGKYNFML